MLQLVRLGQNKRSSGCHKDKTLEKRKICTQYTGQIMWILVNTALMHAFSLLLAISAMICDSLIKYQVWVKYSTRFYQTFTRVYCSVLALLRSVLQV